MAIKKPALVLILIIFLAASYVYLINSYSVNTLEYSFAGELTKNGIDALEVSTKTLISSYASGNGLPYVVNYRGTYRNITLIMTTGMDNIINKISLMKGRWLTCGDIKEAVIGDKAADNIFRSVDIVGQNVNICGQQYKITGIIRDSNEIYISYDEDQKAQWSKKNIRFMIQDQKRLYLYSELLEGKLKTLGLEILDTVIYKQQIAKYLNFILIMVILYLLMLFKKIAKLSCDFVSFLVKDYKQQSRAIELHKYLYSNWRKVIKALLQVLGVLAVIYLCILLIRKMQLPSSLLPNNLFSPTSYINMFKLNYEIYINRIQQGVTGLLLKTHIIDLILLVYIIVAILTILKQKPSVK